MITLLIIDLKGGKIVITYRGLSLTFVRVLLIRRLTYFKWFVLCLLNILVQEFLLPISDGLSFSLIQRSIIIRRANFGWVPRLFFQWQKFVLAIRILIQTTLVPPRLGGHFSQLMTVISLLVLVKSFLTHQKRWCKFGGCGFFFKQILVWLYM